jgi:CO/xanthine dehydrogenase Mo-binding subunit
VWLAQLGPHTGHTAGVLSPLVLAGIGLGMVIAPVINARTFGAAPQDVGVASATVTVGQLLGRSVGASLLNTIFANAVASYTAAHPTSARLIGHQALTGLALILASALSAQPVRKVLLGRRTPAGSPRSPGLRHR